MEKNLKNPYGVENYNEDVEVQLIVDNIPYLFQGCNKKLLYVGANCMRAFFLDILNSIGYVIDIIEIFEGNAKCIEEQYKFRNLIVGDIADEENIKENYDVIFWYHGPEHVDKDKFKKIDELLKNKTKLIILGCPENDILQGEVYGNVFEKHVWSISQQDLIDLKYSTAKCKRNGTTDNIIGWKFY